jgi:hypothetical protein
MLEEQQAILGQQELARDFLDKSSCHAKGLRRYFISALGMV